MTTVVREADSNDVGQIVDMGKRFIAGTQYATLITPDEDAMYRTVAMLVRDHVVLVLDSEIGLLGMLGMATYPHVVSGEICAVELFWWVEPGYRGEGVKMLRRVEQWARSRNATLIQMVQPETEPRLGEIYERLGYTATERQYQKRLRAS